MDTNRLTPSGTLAAILGIREPDLRAAADRGEIPCARVGARGLLFDRELVERILLERASGEAGPPSSTVPRGQDASHDCAEEAQIPGAARPREVGPQKDQP